MRISLAILALLVTAPAAPAQDVLEGWMRSGSVYLRTDMDGGSARACAALCNGDAACQSWVYTQAGFYGPDAQCALLSAAPTPRRAPGRTTGLAPRLVEAIDAASDRAPTAREIEALEAAAGPDRP